ncbi:MAG: ORF2 [Elisy virus]|uniref:ORF2 n=1 Tax=Elisy virus TaxID=2800914 RepID=A0A894KLL4_9RHAB|nr:MAG: ORF2 [Elisy virus]
MDKKLPSIESQISKNVEKITRDLGICPSAVVDRTCPKNLQQIIRNRVKIRGSLETIPFPPGAQEALVRIEQRQRAEEGCEDINLAPTVVMSGQGKDKGSDGAPGSSRTPKSPEPPVLSIEQLREFVQTRNFPEGISKARTALAVWQLSCAYLQCRENCDKLRDQVRADLESIKSYSEDTHDLDQVVQQLNLRIKDLERQVKERDSVIGRLEKENEDKAQMIASLSNTAQTRTDEETRTQVYNKLCQMHPSLVRDQWVSLDQASPLGYFTYPIFCFNGSFVNPYRGCSTESEVQDVNHNLNCSFPYMTIMTLSLIALPDPVKPALIRELGSAKTPLEFFLSLNAIARISPIMTQCIKVLRDARDKDDLRELSSSMNKVTNQLSLNHKTMISFLDQTEQHRNILVPVSKTIQGFIEKFPDTVPKIREMKPKAPATLVFLLHISGLTLALKGADPKNVVLIKDKSCENKKAEDAFFTALSPQLPAIFSLLRDRYTAAAETLAQGLLLIDDDDVELRVKIEKYSG